MKNFNSNIKSIMTILLLTCLIFIGTNILLAKNIKNNDLKIVHLSDVHYDSALMNIGSRMYGDSQNLFLSAIEDINSTDDIDAVVTSGDNITRPSQKDLYNFIKFAKQIKYPFFTTIGNHDVGILGNSSKKFYFTTLKEQYPNIKPDAENTYYITDAIKGYKFIFLDGIIDGKVTSHGFFPNEQLQWLDKQLTENADYKIIVVQHHPLIPPFSGGSHTVVNADEYLKIIEKHKNVIAVLSGHYHCVKATEKNNILHISAPALVQYPNAYRILTFHQSGKCITVKSEFKETGLKDVQEASKIAIKKNLNIYSGEEKDRNFEYTICK